MITTEQQQNLFILLTGHLSKYADLKQEYYKIFSPKPEFIDVFRDLKTNGYLTLRENVSITPEGETLADELLSKASEPIDLTGKFRIVSGISTLVLEPEYPVISM